MLDVSSTILLVAVAAVAFVLLSAVAADRPAVALVFVTALRFVSDRFGNATSASAATIGVTVLGCWIALVAVAAATGQRRRAHIGAPFVLLTLLALWAAFRGLGVTWQAEALRETASWVNLVVLFFAGSVVLSTPRRVQLLARFIGVVGVAQLVIGVGQIATGQTLVLGSYTRIFGTFPHPSWLAMFLVLGIVLLPLTGWKFNTQAVLGGLLLLGVVLTFSRGPLVFLFAWFLAYSVIAKRPRTAAGSIFLAAALMAIPAIRNRFLSEYGDGQLSGSYLSRGLLRQFAIDQWLDAPFVGQGTAKFFAETSPRYFAGESIEAHSDVFKLLADQGLVGLALYGLALLTIALAVRRMSQPWAPAVAALAVTLPLMGVLDVYYRQNTTMAFTWLIFGACWGLSRASGASGTVRDTGESSSRTPRVRVRQR